MSVQQMEAKSGSDSSAGAPAEEATVSPATQLKKEAEEPNSSANGLAIITVTSAHAPPLAGDGASGEMGVGIVPLKRRGRPRKSGDSPWSPTAPTTLAVVPPPSFLTPVEKRGRGRPKGSGNKVKQLIASSTDDSTAGEDFVPHLLSVRPGEDIATKISFFSHEIGARALCVISALGTVSSSVLSQPDSSVGILRNDCECEILSLNGSYIFRETRGVCHKQGMLSVALTMPDGEVVGGRVAGPLIASSIVKLVLGSFRQMNMKKVEKRLIGYEPSSMTGAVYVHIASPRSGPSNRGKSLSEEVDVDPDRRM